MLTVVFGLGAAAAYGAADFIGGILAKRVEPVAVVFLSQLAATPMLLVALVLLQGTFSTRTLMWGTLAGVAGGCGVTFLYRGLARGAMSVIAPVTALEAAGIPVFFGLVVGPVPGAFALAGVLLALVSVLLISSVPDETGARDRTALSDALVAGAGFGAFFILLDRVPDASGVWSLVGVRLGALLFVGAILVLGRRKLPRDRALVPGLVAAGFLDLTANVLYLLATRAGLLAIAAVLTSMYPAGTILLARVKLKERIARIQAFGLGLGAAAVTLISLG